MLREVKYLRAGAYWQYSADPDLPTFPLPPNCSFNQHICAAVIEAPPETVNLTNCWSCSAL